MSAKKPTWAAIFFKSKSEVRDKLAKAVLRGLKTKDFPSIDSLCKLDDAKPSLPTCATVAKDHQRLTGKFFSRVAFPLELTINDALELDPVILGRVLNKVKRQMKANFAMPVSGFPSPGASKEKKKKNLPEPGQVPSDEDAKLYLWLKIIDEIDEVEATNHLAG